MPSNTPRNASNGDNLIFDTEFDADAAGEVFDDQVPEDDLDDDFAEREAS